MLFLFLKVFHGEGNGNPLQYSCLENPVDRGAWWATVHGVARAGPNSVTKKKKKKSVPSRTSLAVHPLRLHASKAGDMGLLSGCKTKIPHVAHHAKKLITKRVLHPIAPSPKFLAGNGVHLSLASAECFSLHPFFYLDSSQHITLSFLVCLQ